MPTTYTQYNDAVAYDAAIRYDGVFTVPDTTPVDTGNRHSAIWRPQRGRSHIHRAIPSLPTFSGVHYRATPKPLTPEIPVSRAIQGVILAPSKDAAQAEILAFVRNKEVRQDAQPELPAATPAPSFLAPPKLVSETAGEQAAHRERQREAAHQRQTHDDGEVLELLSLLEAF